MAKTLHYKNYQNLSITLTDKQIKKLNKKVQDGNAESKSAYIRSLIDLSE